MDSYIKTTNGYTTIENDQKDLRLTINGAETTLTEQIAKKIAANQKNDNSYGLHQDILVINQSGKSKSFSGLIENQLNNSTVKWNKVIIQGKKGETGEPEIFQKIGIAKIVKTARSAGVLKSDLKKNVALSSLLFVISIGLTWLLSFGHSGYELFFREKFVIVGIVLFLILFSLYFLVENHRVIHSGRIRQVLTESANKYTTLPEKGDLFVRKVAEDILGLDMPMAVVVDNITDLDLFTSQVLRELLTSDNNQSVGLILWIVVRNDNSELENTWLNTIINKCRSSKVVYCRA